jgi:hypothetical protein
MSVAVIKRNSEQMVSGTAEVGAYSAYSRRITGTILRCPGHRISHLCPDA